MKETQRRIAITSSLNAISTGQLGNMVVVRGEALTPPPPTILNRYLKTK
jgi:hypothetical protein